jgi:hypothetical protein
MKPRQGTATSADPSCQRPGCSKLGKPRSQTRAGVTRTLNLCNECFELFPAHQLNDLFLRFVGEQINRTVAVDPGDTRHAAALALVGWYLKSGRSGNNWHTDRSARDGSCRRPCDNPGNSNALTNAP